MRTIHMVLLPAFYRLSVIVELVSLRWSVHCVTQIDIIWKLVWLDGCNRMCVKQYLTPLACASICCP